MAGIVGVDPRPFTLRQLTWMVQARQRAEWSRTVAVVSWLYQGRALTADDIAPGVFEPETEPEKTPEQLEAESELAWAQMHAYFRPNAAKQS